MPILQINLLQREQRRVTRLSRATMVVLVATGSIVALMLLVVVFLYTTIAIRSGQKEGLMKQEQEFAGKISEINNHQSQFYPDLTLTQQAIAYQGQVDAAKELVDNHKYFTLYLSEIAQNTPPTIVYTSFSSDSPGRLAVAGSGDSYGDVAKIVESFGKLSFAKNVTLQEAKLDAAKLGKGQAVKFVMVIELKSAAELNKLPGPSGDQPKPKASPGPSPGASPSASAAPGGNLPFGP